MEGNAEIEEKMPPSYKPSAFNGIYGSYSVGYQNLMLPLLDNDVTSQYGEEDEMESPLPRIKISKTEQYVKHNVDLDADLVLDLRHLEKCQELFNVNFNQQWSSFLNHSVSMYLIESVNKFDYYVNAINPNNKVSVDYHGNLCTKVKKNDIIIIRLNQPIVNYAPVPSKPFNVDDVAPPVVEVINFNDDDDEKGDDINKYKPSINRKVMSKLSNVSDTSMKLSKLKEIIPEPASSNNTDTLDYKLTLNMDYTQEFKKVDDFIKDIKSELANTLNVDINHIHINSVQAGSIIIRITVDEKGTTKLVKDHVLNNKQFSYWYINRCINGKNMNSFYKHDSKNFDPSTAMWTFLKSRYSNYDYNSMVSGSKQKYNALKSSHSSLIKPLSFDQIAAIYIYTRQVPKVYGDIRRDSTNMKSEFADFICQLIVGINKLPMVWDKVYRGFSGSFLKYNPNFFNDYKKGNILRLDSMNSSSLSLSFAAGWASSGYGIEINGYHGRDIQPFSAFPGEEEIIFIISSHFLITDQYQSNGRTWFKAKELLFPWDNRAILWVDDNPKGNKHLIEKLEREGTMVIPRISTKQAMDFLGFMKKLFVQQNSSKYRIISDMKRLEKKNENDENSEIVTDKKAGARLVKELRGMGYQNEVCIYTGYTPHAEASCKEFGCYDTSKVKITTSTDDCYKFCQY